MKKIVFVFAAIVAMTFASCGNSSNQGTATDSVAVDSVDTTVVDSVIADTIVADSVCNL